MANQLEFSITSITSTRDSGILSDDTTYSSPARNTLLVYAGGYKINSDLSVDETLTLTGNDEDPSTDVSWEFNLPRDGFFRFVVAAIPPYVGGTTYAIYDAVHSGGVVYRSKQNGNTGQSVGDTAWWEVISSPATLALNEEEVNESANIDSLIYEVGLFPNSEYSFASIIAEASEECCKVDCSMETLWPYNRLAALLDGMYVRSDRSDMVNLEKMARRFESIIETL